MSVMFRAIVPLSACYSKCLTNIFLNGKAKGLFNGYYSSLLATQFLGKQADHNSH